MQALELWGGVECTVNRVADIFSDQCRASGHHDRPTDLDLFADLGIAAIRYPILWERIAPDHPQQRDWTWSDQRLARLRGLGVRPIAGLVHHGSGPRYTHLLADDFAEGVARHAGAVAERYPWITEWTPINEPVTTARFSALYGVWYPHRRDEGAFWCALLNQIDAVRLAMREVRKVNPASRLIQTDDLGRTHATASMRDQAAFDNVRRWTGWDLLFGRVTPQHPFWSRVAQHGLEHRLRAILDDPCPPDVVGVNHYLTSDRFLDHRLQRYPPALWGRNECQDYADTEAVRVVQPPPPGMRGALREAWDRYGVPIAATEVHNGCTREEQMRWTADAWNTAAELRTEGVEVCAVTSWALLGSNDWNTLLTGVGRYEPGAFDVSGGTPRPTALAGLLKGLTKGPTAGPPLGGVGWWRRAIRLHHPVVPRPAPMREHLRPSPPSNRVPPVLITGATGTLGQAFAAACHHRDIPYVLTTRGELDVTNLTSIAAALDAYRPWAVINAAGWVRVDDAEAEPEACYRANAEGPALLAEECARRAIQTVNFSTDLVFDGHAGCAYLESDPTAPLSVYGDSKVRAERAVAELEGSHLLVRTAAFFSPFDVHNFAFHAARAAAEGRPFRAAADHIVSPTYVPELCNAVLDLVIDEATGLWHLTSGEALSWADFACRIAERCGLDTAMIEPVAGAALGWSAPRPLFAALASARGTLLAPLTDSIGRFATEMLRSGVLRRPVDTLTEYTRS